MKLRVAALALCCALPAWGQGLRRFAVIAGNDEGGERTRPLLYAREDAKKIHEILLRVGGVREEDATLLLNADSDELLQALSLMERRSSEARRRGERTALFVYYSGHARDGSLRLGDTVVPFESLKGRLAQAPADVRIAVFDSCRSGAMTRTKGARKAPAFEIESDATRSARGLVILTSSASDEDSQESDHIGGSYFSHHLASAMMGDADRSGDGRVSLSEAYAYAYERTVADTADSAAGAQHPTFAFDLAGNGDVVLTEVAARREGLYFPAAAPPGAYFLVDRRGAVAAEVWKEAGVERRIALAPGSYKVKRRLEDRLRLGEVVVAGGQLTTLDESLLKDAPFSDDPVKGLSAEVRARLSLGVSATYQSFFLTPLREGYFPPGPLFGADLLLHDFFGRGWILGADVFFGSSQNSLSLIGLGASAPYRFSELVLSASVLREWTFEYVAPFAGIRLSAILMGRDFESAELPDQALATFSPGLVLGLRIRLPARFSLTTRGRLHYLLYNADGNRSLGYWELAQSVSYEF